MIGKVMPDVNPRGQGPVVIDKRENRTFVERLSHFSSPLNRGYHVHVLKRLGETYGNSTTNRAAFSLTNLQSRGSLSLFQIESEKEMKYRRDF